MNVYRSNCSGTCGLDVIYAFNSRDQEAMRMFGLPITGLLPRGAGFSVAGFINTHKCKQAYKELAEKFKTVYQSPVRRNRNSRRKFFFVIYDTETSSQLIEKEN